MIFDTETGLSSKSIKLLESDSQKQFKEFEEDKKVSVYLYKNKIIPLISKDDSELSDSQSSEELLNDEEIDSRIIASKITTDTSFMNKSLIPINKITSQGVKIPQNHHLLRPNIINSSQSLISNQNDNWQGILPQSKLNITPDKNRKIYEKNLSKISYNSISQYQAPPGLDMNDSKIPQMAQQIQVPFGMYPPFMPQPRDMAQNFQSNKTIPQMEKYNRNKLEKPKNTLHLNKNSNSFKPKFLSRSNSAMTQPIK